MFILFRLKDQWAILYYFVHHIGEQQNELGVSEIEANIWLMRAAKKKKGSINSMNLNVNILDQIGRTFFFFFGGEKEIRRTVIVVCT